MARREAELGPGLPEVEEFAAGLRRLRDKAGGPGYRELARRARYSVTTLSDAAGGRRLPTLAVTLAYVEACGGDRAEWEERWRRVAANGTPPQDDVPPYQGLAAYDTDRAEWFFGRAGLVADLLNRLAARRFLAVFGASGSGKSSVLRAGLVPVVAESGPAVVMTPGADPTKELAIALSAHLSVPVEALRADLAAHPAHLHLAVRQLLADRPIGAELFLVVDQFEEIFTQCRDEEARKRFTDALLAAVRTSGSRLRVVLGVRADFYGRCSELPELADALADAQVLVGPMTAEQVREAVVRPAERAGSMVEGSLVSVIVAMVAGRAGALPMASHALLEAWSRRRGSAITLSGYQAAGGVDGAVAQTAEQVWQDLDDHQRRAARHALLRMVEIGAGDGTVTGRRVDRAEFDDADPVTAHILERLAAARLVTLDERSVRVAHEALLAAWPRLRGWVEEDQDGVRVHRQLTHAATVWRSLDRDPGGLYRGVALSRAGDWADEHPDRLTVAEREYLDASRHARSAATARRRRLTRTALAVLAVVAAVVTALALVATGQAGRARDQRDLARHGQQIANARAQMPRDPQLALMLALRAYQARPDAQAETVLRQATLNWRVLAERPVFGPRIKAAALTPDGRFIAAGAEDGVVSLWNTDSGRPAVKLREPGSDLYRLVITRDGRRVAGSHGDGLVRLWNLADPAAPPAVLRGHTGAIRALDFSPDGRYLAVGDQAGITRVWDLSGAPRARAVPGNTGPVGALAFAPDGRLAIAGDRGPTRIWDPADLARPRAELPGSTATADSLLFSPDGRSIAAGDGTTLRIWPVGPAGSGAPVVLGRERGVSPRAFSPDGRRLFGTTAYGVISVWDTTGPADPLLLRGHAGPDQGAQLAPDGRLVSVGDDGVVRYTDVGGPYDPMIARPHRGLAHVARFSPDGRYVASAGISDGTVRVWPAGGGGSPVVLPGHQGMTMDVSYAPDGRRLATLDMTGTIRVWDPSTGRRLAMFGAGPASRLAFGPDGRRILAIGRTGGRILDASGTGRPVPLPAGQGAAFSPDGRRVAVGGPDGAVRVLDAASGRTLLTLRGHDGPVTGPAYAPDGGRIASLGTDSTIRVWPAGGGTPVTISAAGLGGTTTRLVFTPDGGRLALLGGDDLTGVQLWSIGSGTEPVTVRPLGPGPMGFSFSADGGRVVTVHADSSIRVWTCEVCGSIAQVRALAGRRAQRPFTPDERRTFALDG